MWFFLIYLIIAVILYLIVYIRMRIHAARAASAKSGSRVSIWKVSVKGDPSNKIAGFILIFFGIMVLIGDAIIQDYWIRFDEKRTAEMEERYGMIFDETVTLKKYTCTLGGQGGTEHDLYFETEQSGLPFIKEHCTGELSRYIEEGMRYKIQEDGKLGDPEPFFQDEGTSGVYYYEHNGNHFNMKFYEDNGIYRVKVSY